MDDYPVINCTFLDDRTMEGLKKQIESYSKSGWFPMFNIKRIVRDDDCNGYCVLIRRV
jgi:hypothetical protein